MQQVNIFEVGPRDGLQNEKRFISTADKIALVDRLSATGLTRIEVTSFVSPEWVPQMADATEVLTGISRTPGVTYSALTPNIKGYFGARLARVGEVAVFASASEGFSQNNLNCTIAESLERFAPVLAAAEADGVPVRGYVSCVTDCPYDGPTPPINVARVARSLFDMGCYEVSLGDTIGSGTPESVNRMLDAVLDVASPEALAGHYHDTHNRALDNIEVSLERGLRTFDSSVAGLGGCPYAPGAKGNVATGQVLTMLHHAGYQTGIDATLIAETESWIRGIVGTNEEGRRPHE